MASLVRTPLTGAALQLGGDLSGTTSAASVINIYGASVPIAGSLTTGNVLQVTGSSALSYAAINLAGGNNFVTGNLPVSNVSPGTSAQVLMSNGTPATTWTTLSSDVTISATGATTVNSISGASPIAITPATLQWATGTASPTLTQATAGSDVATNNLTIQSQGPFASAVTNKATGNIVVNFPTAVAGANGSTGLGGVIWETGGISVGAIRITSSTGLGNALTIYGNETTPGSANWFFAGASGQNFINATSELCLGLQFYQ